MPPPTPLPPGHIAGLPAPILFNLLTIHLMIAITFLMEGILIALSAYLIRSYRGVGLVAVATLTLSAGFFVLPNRNGPDPVDGLISNILLTVGFLLMYVATSLFTESKYHRVIAYGLVPGSVIMMIVGHFIPSFRIPMVFISSSAIFILTVLAGVTLIRSKHDDYKLTTYLTAVPLLLFGLSSLARLLIGIFNTAETVPGPTGSTIFNVMALFVLSFLWSAGFILMVNQRMHSQLNDLAMNDALTRVRNRRAMQDTLDFEMSRLESETRDFSILLLDIDHFKSVNDTYGHQVGDKVLKWFATTLQHNMRIQDIVARWGGEEFLIMLPDTNLKEAIQMGERLRKTIEETPFITKEVELKITFSAGVSNSIDNRDVDQLVKMADDALYKAKETRNRIVSYQTI